MVNDHRTGVLSDGHQDIAPVVGKLHMRHGGPRLWPQSDGARTRS
jgi:hypothetical protein